MCNSKDPSVITEYIISWFSDILLGYENVDFELVKRASYIHALQMQSMGSFSLFSSAKRYKRWEVVKTLIKNYKKP